MVSEVLNIGPAKLFHSILHCLGDWPAQLGNLLEKAGKKAALDVVVDSAGGDIIGQCSRMLAWGARIVCYGM